jgi:hypothetical protein
MSEQESRYATTEALAGVASEVEALRKRAEPLHRLPGRVEQLATLVDKLATDLAEFMNRSSPVAIPSWLMLPTDPEAVRNVLAELVAWLERVYLRYPDGAAALPECWLWHPDVVEELLWLQHAWLAAYQGSNASVALAGDWHDRYRPGVVRRIKAHAGNCSLENHTDPQPPHTAPLAEATSPIAGWWAEHRDQAAPEPTEDHFAAVLPRRRLGGTRR